LIAPAGAVATRPRRLLNPSHRKITPMSNSISTNVRADIYDRVTTAIIRELEAGTRPWIKPWTTSSTGTGTIMRPLRHDSVPYRGINIVILWSEAAERGFSAPTWMTYRQAQLLGAQVRKGEGGTTVVYANAVERSETDAMTGEDITQRIPYLRAYTVFNIEQIDGLPERYCSKPTAEENLSGTPGRIDRADAFIAATGAIIRTSVNRACYIPSVDRIEMPPYRQFMDTPTSTAAEAYYSTLLHELIHYTSPSHRCGRDFGKRFADHAYAREELVAEIGAAFLCADLGITLETRPDHAAYVASWLTVLKSDKRAIFSAAALAQKAANWLFQKVESSAASEE
jgi:antirestriction protein ArdC